MTALTLKLGEHTSFDDVAAWPDPNGQSLVFVLARASGFEPGADGAALSFLATAIDQRTPVAIQCEFHEPANEREFFSSPLASTFGYALLRVADAITFGRENVNRRDSFRATAGQIYDLRKGVIGLGDRVELIAFDPRRPVPRALLARAQTIDQDGLPLPSAFQQDLVRTLSGMGLPEIASQSTLPTIISFVYELFLNTVQHGLPTDLRRLSLSTRGIVLTKIAYSLSQIEGRHLSVSLKEYLHRVAELEKRTTNLHVACISVLDMGDGIQNTLPKASEEDETNETRLTRAFQVGQSRKSQSAVERGLGLHKVLDAAMTLNARLHVLSAGELLTKDFSLGEDRYPSLHGSTRQTLPGHFKYGTTVTLFVPDYSASVDQRKLGL